MVLKGELGNAKGATPAIVSTTMRPSVHRKRTVRVFHPHINVFRNSSPTYPILTNPCRRNYQTWMDQWNLLGSMNTPFQRFWE